MLTTAEAAAALGVTRRQVLKLISQGKITATRFGIAWQVDEASVKVYQSTEHKPGWKKGRKRVIDSNIDSSLKSEAPDADAPKAF
jgi:excisionase family DNA binding protein